MELPVARVALVVGLTLVSASFAGPAPRPATGAGDHNVIVIVLDDLGTDKLRMYRENASAPPTPHLDALWGRGIQFTNAYVNPVCSPTRAAILTGRYGFRTGIGTHISEGDSPPYSLPNEEILLPELLSGATLGDYVSGAFGKWHLTLYSGDDCHAGANGFQRYQISMGNNANYYRWRKVSNDPADPADCISTDIPLPGEPNPFSMNTWAASVARADAVNWIKNELPTGQRFFAYVAFNPPHAPQQVPPLELLSRRSRANVLDLDYAPGDSPERRHRRFVHDLMIEAVDADIGLLLDPTNGIPQATLDETMVIVIGDNGTETQMIEAPQDPSHGKRTLYQGGVRVPMIVAGPLVPTQFHASFCEAFVNAVDLWRTVGNLAGLSDQDIDDYVDLQFPPGTHPIDGMSFVDLIEDPDLGGARDFVYGEFFPNGPPPPPTTGLARMVRDGDFKYIRRSTYPAEELYNVELDPDETDDILDHASLTTLEKEALCRLRSKVAELSGGYGCVGLHQMGPPRVSR